MKRDQIVAQLYSARDVLRTPVEIGKTLARLARVGYRAVQVSGLGPIAEDELKRILDGEGLACIATHEPAPTLLDEPEAVADRLEALGCAMTAYPHPGKLSLATRAGVEKLAGRLEHTGAVLHDRGIGFGYHNHALEMHRVGGGQTALEIILEKTSPQHLFSELDTYWAHHGGADVVALLERLANRIPAIHIKDYGVDDRGTPQFEEIGSGNFDWQRIVATAESGGCQWFIIEQDRYFIDDDPVLSLAESYRYLAEAICTD